MSILYTSHLAVIFLSLKVIHESSNLFIVLFISVISLSVTLNFTFFPSIFTSVFLKIKHANFQSLVVSGTPSSIVILENHAVPLQLPTFPPNLNPIFTSSLFLELNKSSIFCQSLEPVIAIDLVVVPSILI